MTVSENSVAAACPNGHAFRVKAKAAGRVVRCPKCKSATKIPKLQTAVIGLGEPPKTWTDSSDIGHAIGFNDELAPQSDPPHFANNDVDVAESASPADSAPEPSPLPRFPFNLPATRDYPALRQMIQNYKRLAFIMLIGLVLFGVLTLVLFVTALSNDRPEALAGASVCFAITLACAVLRTFYRVLAEGIQLSVDIQENTFVTAHLTRAIQDRG